MHHDKGADGNLLPVYLPVYLPVQGLDSGTKGRIHGVGMEIEGQPPLMSEVDNILL